MSKEFLRKLPLFGNLTAQDMDRLYELAEPVDLAPGQTLMEEGEPGDAVYVVLDGNFRVTKRSGREDVVIAGCKPGDVIGEISLLDRARCTVTVRSLSRSRALKISRDSFDRLLSSSPSAAIAVLHTVMQRLRNTESALMQHEKLAALGTMSAGLAHELNNPAGAVMRGADQLRRALHDWQAAALALERAGLNPQAIEELIALHAEIEARTAAPGEVDPLESSDRADAIEEWLGEYGVDAPWEAAPALAALDWDRERLESTAARFGEAQQPGVARWLGATAQIAALLLEVSAGAGRMAEIVKAVKSYTHLDEAPVQEVDVREGIENTLLILHHKLKRGVSVRREYAADAPRIEAYAGDLNQVWTNLIDNAIDAMGGRGEVTIRTRRVQAERPGADGAVAVEICDNGPGIPDDVREQIFEPFFTTKPPGMGTGLGLHLVYNIVVLKHNGQVTVDSQPGRTCFNVTLPIRLARQASPVDSPANGNNA